jgi:hypothetical protein
MHCLLRQHCFDTPWPPNFFMSLQYLHSPQSSRVHGSHPRHRIRRLRSVLERGMCVGLSRLRIEPLVRIKLRITYFLP